MDKTSLVAAIGADLKSMREASGQPQQTIADLFGWTRDAVSKIERGVNAVSAADYFEIVAFLASSNPGHLAIPLYQQYRTQATRR